MRLGLGLGLGLGPGLGLGLRLRLGLGLGSEQRRRTASASDSSGASSAWSAAAGPSPPAAAASSTTPTPSTSPVVPASPGSPAPAASSAASRAISAATQCSSESHTPLPPSPPLPPPVALTAARLGSTDTSKPAASPRAVPRLSALPSRRHSPRQRRSAADWHTARGAAASRWMEAAVACSSCGSSAWCTWAYNLVHMGLQPVGLYDTGFTTAAAAPWSQPSIYILCVCVAAP